MVNSKNVARNPLVSRRTFLAASRPFFSGLLFASDEQLRLGAQSVKLLSTLRNPTQLRRRQWACTCYAMFEWKKTQILIAHQKQTIDRTKKVRVAAKKSSARD